MRIKSEVLLFTVLMVFLSGCSGDWIGYSPIDMYMANIGYDDADASRHLNVAAASLQVHKTDKNVTLGRLQAMVAKIMAEHPETQVIVFPELAFEWYWDEDSKGDYQIAMAEQVPGTVSDAVKTYAQTYGVAIAFGLTETEAGKLYNTQLLIKADGSLLKYRKRNLNQTDRDNGMLAGSNGLVSADLDGIRVCLFICSDMQSVDITRELADSEVEVILHSLTTTTELNPTVSYVGTQMNKWIVFANRYGTEGDFDYSGFVQIINPAGTVSERDAGAGGYAFRRLGLK